MQRCETAQELAEELRDFNREQELPVDTIPSANILRMADRHDLLTEIQRFGGALALAPQIGMKTQRGPGFQSVSNAARQLLLFVQKMNKTSQARHSWHMPTQQQLRKAGRHDLLNAILKYGQAPLAEAAQLKQNRRGNPRRKPQSMNLAV